MNTLVVPSNSPSRVQAFLDAWRPWPWDRIVLVLDEPSVDPELREALAEDELARVRFMCWADIDEQLPHPEIISRRDSAIRSAGFWRAWSDGARVIHTLDDDCFPAGDDVVAGHLANLFATPAWQSTVDGLRVRGIPYVDQGTLADVHLSMGLWKGVPDIDAVTALSGREAGVSIVSAPTRVMPESQYFPLSGMNLAFTREVACIMYFAPMGLGQPFGRFDDIWCGILAQRIFRHLRLAMTTGAPFIEHLRASDAIVNLVKEAPGVAVNERLWRQIDELELSAREPLPCMREAGAGLARSEDQYLAGWGRSIGLWCDLFERDALAAGATR